MVLRKKATGELSESCILFVCYVIAWAVAHVQLCLEREKKNTLYVHTASKHRMQFIARKLYMTQPRSPRLFKCRGGGLGTKKLPIICTNYIMHQLQHVLSHFHFAEMLSVSLNLKSELACYLIPVVQLVVQLYQYRILLIFSSLHYISSILAAERASTRTSSKLQITLYPYSQFSVQLNYTFNRWRQPSAH